MKAIEIMNKIKNKKYYYIYDKISLYLLCQLKRL